MPRIPDRRIVRSVKASGVTFLRRTDRLWRGMDEYETEYYRNFLVHGCVDARAFWATKEGFDTVIEDVGSENLLSQAKKDELKAYVDAANTAVRLDERLRLALRKAQIWGTTGFEIEFEKKDNPWLVGNKPIRLNSLKSKLLKPEVDLDAWKLESFEYNGKPAFYDLNEILYFVRNEIDDDWTGRSDIEPVIVESALDDRIIREDLMEAATTLWAGIMVHQLILEKAAKAGIKDDADIDKYQEAYRDQLRPGKHIITDDLWNYVPVDIKPDLTQLLNVSDKLERRVLGSFKVPRFLLNIEKELNRATAEKELEAFVDGAVTDDQRWLRRPLEEQWYKPLTYQFLSLKPEETAPARVVHRWRQIRVEDWLNLLDTAIKGYAEGRGALSLPKFYELIRDGKATSFNPEEISQPAGQTAEIPLDIIARPQKQKEVDKKQ